MARRALIIGGTGQIGRAVAESLLGAGWSVVCAQRGKRAFPEDLFELGASSLALDRNESGAIAQAVGGGVDALIDTVAYTADHASQLLAVAADVGTFVVVSSASVYRDQAGRSLIEAEENGFPDLPVPITEDQPTVPPGPQTYSTRKAGLEQALLQQASVPTAILRPCAIYGPGSFAPREWWFLKRLLDGRRAVPLAYDGESRFHTTATVNIAALCRVVLDAPFTGVLNIGDPVALSVRGIGQAIAAHYAHDWELIGVPGRPRGGVGESPWCVAAPFVVDMSKSEALGYRPAASYSEAVAAACNWLKRASQDHGWREKQSPPALFDYVSEDAFFASQMQSA